MSSHEVGGQTERLARVQVAIIFRESARRDFQTNGMAPPEDVTRIPAVNRVLVDLPRLNQLRLIQAVAEARTDQPITKTLGETCGPYVDQLGGEIRIGR